MSDLRTVCTPVVLFNSIIYMSRYLGENRGIIGFSPITRRPGPGGVGKCNTSSWKTINFLFYAVHNIRLPEYVRNWDMVFT